ncbi:hypothetical protein VNO80_06863 [Phaseolus coccineus]|uniref:Uncharacterized protein n=1 Tax=Phaseolus coccineus TaxID=3886 RepID=A0AAN9NHL6_PHACN
MMPTQRTCGEAMQAGGAWQTFPRREDKPERREHTVALLDLDPWIAEPRLEVGEDLHRVPLLDGEHTTSMGTSLAAAEAEAVHQESSFRILCSSTKAKIEEQSQYT